MVQSATGNVQRATCYLQLAAAANAALVDSSSFSSPLGRILLRPPRPTINNKPFVDFGLDGGGGGGGGGGAGGSGLWCWLPIRPGTKIKARHRHCSTGMGHAAREESWVPNTGNKARDMEPWGTWKVRGLDKC